LYTILSKNIPYLKLNIGGPTIMLRLNFLLFIFMIFAFCQPEQQPQQAQSQGLRKIYYKNQQEVQQLRQAGAEIIVQEPDYVIIRTDSMLQALSVKSDPIEETDLVQRLVKIHVKDSQDIQTVANSGIDLWEVKGDTALGRAFDIYIERLKKAGLSVKIVAEDASKWEEK